MAEDVGDLTLAGTVEPPWVEAVLRYWFEELSETHWFGGNDGVDMQIRGRFLALHEQLARINAPGVNAPRSILAAVIVLDQFSRNMYRGHPRAYAADAIARRLARTAVDQGFDLTMTKKQRLFLYLPFEHSENTEDQALALDLIGRLGNENWTRATMAHKVIIDRFGRFPHRNQILGRSSTPDEIAHMAESMTSF